MIGKVLQDVRSDFGNTSKWYRNEDMCSLRQVVASIGEPDRHAVVLTTSHGAVNDPIVGDFIRDGSSYISQTIDEQLEG